MAVSEFQVLVKHSGFYGPLVASSVLLLTVKGMSINRQYCGLKTHVPWPPNEGPQEALWGYS